MGLFESNTNDRTRRLAVEMNKAGATQKAIAEELRMCTCSVVAILKEAGVYKPRKLLGDHPAAIVRCGELVNGGLDVAASVHRTNAEFGIDFSYAAYVSAMARDGLYQTPRTRAKLGIQRPMVEEAAPPAPSKPFVEYDGLVIPRTQVNGISLAAPGLRFATQHQPGA